MSRTKRGNKSVGWEVWSKRPGDSKEETKGAERMQSKEITQEEIAQMWYDMEESGLKQRVHLLLSSSFGYRLLCSADQYELFDEVPHKWEVDWTKVTCKKCLKKLMTP